MLRKGGEGAGWRSPTRRSVLKGPVSQSPPREAGLALSSLSESVARLGLGRQRAARGYGEEVVEVGRILVGGGL